MTTGRDGMPSGRVRVPVRERFGQAPLATYVYRSRPCEICRWGDQIERDIAVRPASGPVFLAITMLTATCWIPSSDVRFRLGPQQ